MSLNKRAAVPLSSRNQRLLLQFLWCDPREIERAFEHFHEQKGPKMEIEQNIDYRVLLGREINHSGGIKEIVQEIGTVPGRFADRLYEVVHVVCEGNVRTEEICRGYLRLAIMRGGLESSDFEKRKPGERVVIRNLLEEMEADYKRHRLIIKEKLNALYGLSEETSGLQVRAQSSPEQDPNRKSFYGDIDADRLDDYPFPTEARVNRDYAYAKLETKLGEVYARMIELCTDLETLQAEFQSLEND